MDEKLYRRIRLLMQDFDGFVEGGGPVCLAIADTDLGLIALLRMPGVHQRIEHMAIGKAYTCAKMGCSTEALHQRLLREQLSLADFMDVRLTGMQGGVPLKDESGAVVAGIGVSGRAPADDEALAMKIRDFLAQA